MILKLDESGILGISDKQFVQLNIRLKALEKNERKKVIDQFAKMISERLHIAGFDKIETDRMFYVFKKNWLDLIEKDITDFNSRHLYEKSLQEWKNAIAELEGKEHRKKQLVKRLLYYSKSFAIPAAIGGALIGNTVAPGVGAIIGLAAGAFVASLAKEGEND